MQDRNVIVLANLKPRNMRGIKSNGMLMAASDASHENVELLIPPEGSFPGERVWFGSEEEKDCQSDPASPNQVSHNNTDLRCFVYLLNDFLTTGWVLSVDISAINAYCLLAFLSLCNDLLLFLHLILDRPHLISEKR